MLQKLRTLSVGLIALFATLPAVATSADENIQTLKANIIEHFSGDNMLDIPATKLALESINDDGSWSSIDYSTTVATGWHPLDHILNMLLMSAAYRNENSPYYHDADVAKKYRNALYFWIKRKPKTVNWWQGDIGIPKALAPSLMLMDDVITAEDLANVKYIMYHPKLHGVGQNRVWIAGNILFRGVLYNNIEEVELGSKIVKELIRVNTDDEGIQTDNSFQQHGTQLQFGNYGLHFIEETSKWSDILKGTNYSLTPEQSTVVRNYIKEGISWVIWKGSVDLSACGRQIYENGTRIKNQQICHEVKVIQSVDKQHAEDYNNVFDYRNLSGDKHFWCSDFHVKRNNDYYVSIKMCSERVAGTESWGNENRKAYHSSDGVMMLYQRGDEYENIAPLWNWRKVPGITAPQINGPYIPNKSWLGYNIDSRFVGGLSTGVDGVAAMRYIRDSITADKSWFLIDDAVICLGSNINSENSAEVTTCVNQTNARGEVYTNLGKMNRESLASQDIRWVWHDNTGYLFPEGGEVNVSDCNHQGRWYDIAPKYSEEVLTKRVFTLWVSHGTKQKDQKYQYVVLPNVTKEECERAAKSHKYSVVNRKDIQVVNSPYGSKSAAVLYRTGKCDVLGGVELSQAAIIFADRSGQDIVLTISDPTRDLKSIDIEVNGNYKASITEEHGAKLSTQTIGGKTRMKLDLPQGGFAGKSVAIRLTN